MQPTECEKIFTDYIFDKVLISRNYTELKLNNKKGPIQNWAKDFPGGAVVKNLPANAGDMGLSPGPGRSHMLRSN